MCNSIIKSSQWKPSCSVWTDGWKDMTMLIAALHTVSQKCLKIHSGMSYLWNISCSCDRLILSARCGSTFSFSFSSNCCVVSRQYSAVVRILTKTKVLTSKIKYCMAWYIQNCQYLSKESNIIMPLTEIGSMNFKCPPPTHTHTH